jgi:cation diffusion facilitator CzcD-associated flavoprotein CzcO
MIRKALTMTSYPGCACDIPAHSYVFPFEPHPDWSGYYAYSSEIHNYMMACAKKWDVEKFVKLQREVVSATWDEERGKWEVETKVTGGDGKGTTEREECDILVNGSGVLTKWKWPDIEGLQGFKGTLAHSAAWDQNLDWADKRVAVIGSGSSSIQMVPRLAATAKSLQVFMRNPTYIGPQIGSSVSNKEADPEAMEPGAAQVHRYTEKEIDRFRSDPEYHLDYRKRLEQAVVGGFKMFYRGSELNQQAKAMMQADMANKLGHDEELKKKLIPNWSPGCRRLTPGEQYLETLIKPHVSTVHEKIVKITPKGILTDDGVEHEIDFLACATGFNVAYMPHFKIIGTGGQVMQDNEEPNVYASVAVPGFPNYFIINGQRGNWVGTS